MFVELKNLGRRGRGGWSIQGNQKELIAEIQRESCNLVLWRKYFHKDGLLLLRWTNPLSMAGMATNKRWFNLDKILLL